MSLTQLQRSQKHLKVGRDFLVIFFQSCKLLRQLGSSCLVGLETSTVQNCIFYPSLITQTSNLNLSLIIIILCSVDTSFFVDASTANVHFIFLQSVHFEWQPSIFIGVCSAEKMSCHALGIFDITTLCDLAS